MVKILSHDIMTTFKFMFIWKIDQFSRAPKNKKLFSPKFSYAGHDLQFQLFLYPLMEKDEKFMGLSMSCLFGKTIKGDIPIYIELSLLKSNMENFMKSEGVSIFKESGSYSEFGKFAEYSHVTDPKNDFLHENHQLVVCCKATVSYTLTDVLSLPASVNQYESKFKSDLKSLLGSEEFSDFTIAVDDGTEIPVHKIILSARSPVFKAMFSVYTKESQEKKVDIPEVSADVMKVFLQFIYTGEVKPEDDQMTVELLALADKYQVDDLKMVCETYISSILSIENVVSVYAVADLHNATELKAKCLTFIAHNFKQVSLTKEYEQMCRTGGEKMIEVTRALSNLL